MNPSRAWEALGRDAMCLGAALLLCTGCMALRYEDATPSAAPTMASSSSSPPASAPSPPSPASASAPASAEASLGDAREAAEPSLSWNELCRLAREDRQQRRFESADARLRQAAQQVADRPTTDVSRRVVFSQRARLALELDRADRSEDAERLTTELIEEARRNPGVGRASLVDLVNQTFERRARSGAPELDDAVRLEWLELAFDAALEDSASRERVTLAFRLAHLARHLGQPGLARRAIDQALLDARVTAPLDHDQTAALELARSRIALSQGDLEVAEASALASNRLFEEIDAPAARRGLGEANYAHVLAARGESDRARAIARGAAARLDSGEAMPDAVRRAIVGDLARVERLSGDLEAARRAYREALAIPASDSTLDRFLREDLQHELALVEASKP